MAAAAGPDPGLDVHCEGLVQIYPMPDGDVVALRGVDLDIDGGELLALLGPSGSGKSTLLMLMAGLLRPSAGRLRIGERDIARASQRDLAALRGREVSLVLQGSGWNLLPYATAAQNVRWASRQARRTGRGQAGRAGRGDPAGSDFDTGRWLGRLGLGHVAGTPAAQLSGGEQQRVALAAGCASAPRLLLVDEPTSELDATDRDRVVELLGTLHAELGCTVVIITHDPAVAAAVPRTVTIRDGRVGAEGRHGEDYAVVGQDGAVSLPPDVLKVLPRGTLVRLHRHSAGVDLRNPDLDR